MNDSTIPNLLGKWNKLTPLPIKWTYWSGSELYIAIRQDWMKLQQVVKKIDLKEWSQEKVIFLWKWTGIEWFSFSEKINRFKNLTDIFLICCKSGKDLLSQFVQESYRYAIRILQDSEIDTYISGKTKFTNFEECALCCMSFQKNLSKLREILKILEYQLKIFIEGINPAEVESADCLYSMF